MVTAFLSILNQMEFHLVQNRRENCRHDHIQLNLKGKEILLISMHSMDCLCHLCASSTSQPLQTFALSSSPEDAKVAIYYDRHRNTDALCRPNVRYTQISITTQEQLCKLKCKSEISLKPILD